MPRVNESKAAMASRAAARTVYIPKFIHKISAKEAEQLLLAKGIDGSFLVRTSTDDPNVYCLSYRELNKIFHMKFKTTEEGFTVEHISEEFPTIGELIRVVQTVIPGLLYALWPSDPAPEGLLPRMFFGRLTSKHAEKILLDRDAQPDRNFLIRGSTTFTDQIVLSVRLPNGEVVHILTERQGDKILLRANPLDLLFRNFKELIDYCMDSNFKELEHEDGTIIKLLKPMICPWNKDPSIQPPTSKEVGLPASPAKPNTIAEEFETLQSEECSPNPQKSEYGRRLENIPKNRYKSILPYDDTRVVLDPPQDYINANYLKTDERLGVYIGCQGPLPHTATDFWRMIWKEKCRFIVMLANTVEAGKNKCHPYWAKDKDKDQMYEQFVIKHHRKVSSTKDYIITELKLINGDEEMPVFHCHYIGWPEKSVPKNIYALVQFSEDILRMRSSVTDRRPGPIVAHCSAGIGRTGTYVLISMIINHIQLFGDAPDILNFSKLLQQQRPGMVQTLQQYELLYKATEIYRSKVTSESVSVLYANMDTAAGNVYENVNPSSS